MKVNKLHRREVYSDPLRRMVYSDFNNSKISIESLLNGKILPKGEEIMYILRKIEDYFSRINEHEILRPKEDFNYIHDILIRIGKIIDEGNKNLPEDTINLFQINIWRHISFIPSEYHLELTKDNVKDWVLLMSEELGQGEGEWIYKEFLEDNRDNIDTGNFISIYTPTVNEYNLDLVKNYIINKLNLTYKAFYNDKHPIPFVSYGVLNSIFIKDLVIENNEIFDLTINILNEFGDKLKTKCKLRIEDMILILLLGLNIEERRKIIKSIIIDKKDIIKINGVEVKFLSRSNLEGLTDFLGRAQIIKVFPEILSYRKQTLMEDINKTYDQYIQSKKTNTNNWLEYQVKYSPPIDITHTIQIGKKEYKKLKEMIINCTTDFTAVGTGTDKKSSVNKVKIKDPLRELINTYSVPPVSINDESSKIDIDIIEFLSNTIVECYEYEK